MKQKRKAYVARAPRQPKLTVAECGYVLHLPGNENSGSIPVWYLCNEAGGRMGRAQMNNEMCDHMLANGELINGRVDDLTGGMIYAYSPITTVNASKEV